MPLLNPGNRSAFWVYTVLVRAFLPLALSPDIPPSNSSVQIPRAPPPDFPDEVPELPLLVLTVTVVLMALVPRSG